MRIGIFGGSFDPIHIEHIRLAEAAIQSLQLDKLWIMPAASPPHKKGKRLAPADDRLQMCRLAFEGNERVAVSDYEILQDGTSYTYLTCQHFKSLYPNDELFWLVGTDMLRDFPTWKNPETILQNVTLAVCARAEESGWEEKEHAAFVQRFGKDFATIHYNASAVSSTEIRVLTGAGMRVTHLTDEKVAAYIQEKGLYKIPNADKALSLQSSSRAKHSVRVALAAARVANKLHISELQAIQAALFHDCAKNLHADDALLKGFVLEDAYGEVPAPVWHQFAGAYLAQAQFGITDEDVLNAIRYHTSGRKGMSVLEQIVFLADMVEDERSFDGVDKLRSLFYQGKLHECMREALARSLDFIQEKGGAVYPLTAQAYQDYQ